MSPRRRIAVLLAGLAAAIAAWLFRPYPDPYEVPRAFIQHVNQSGTVLLNSVDSASPESYEGPDPESGRTVRYVRRTETEPDTGRTFTYWPRLSSVLIEDPTVINELTRDLLPAKADGVAALLDSASKRLRYVRWRIEHPRRRYDEIGGAMGCGFAPDFELSDLANPDNAIFLCLSCRELRCWYNNNFGRLYLPPDVKDRYLAIAAELGMQVSSRHSSPPPPSP